MQMMIRLMRWIIGSGDKKRLAKQFDPADDLVKYQNIPYVDDGTAAHYLDIYRPSNIQGKLPVIVDIHGGALILGDKDLNRYSNYELARRGFAVASISYRLMPEACYRDQLQDVLSALAFLPMVAETYGMDLDNVMLLGDSAGGLLALTAVETLQCGTFFDMFQIQGPPFAIRGMGLISPMSYTVRKDKLKMIGPYLKDNSELDTLLCDPLGYLDKCPSFPKTWILTSAQDFIRDDALRLKAAMEKKHLAVQFTDQPKGEEHELAHVYPVSYPKYPESQQALDSLCDFFRSCMKKGV